ncbi:MAG: NAD(P)/FAD-dependent oxidoreductase [Verrucomicrobiota bacterium]
MNKPVLVVGAGMAGLSCAVHLQRAGIPSRVFEASDDVGGRVRTDCVNGFLLDRGFQVYLDAYPETGKLLDLESLDLRGFAPGALVYKEGNLYRLMDVFRRPNSAIASLRAPIGSFADKLRVGRMRSRLLRSSLAEIASRPDQSTEDYLASKGFSGQMIDSFFRSFYGGIFLERELRTSSRMFEFTFKMFGQGSATIPARGMGQIPKQLASQLPGGTVSLNTSVAEVSERRVTLETGEQIDASVVVLATDSSQIGKLLPISIHPEPRWRSVTNVYFSAKQSPTREAIICLNGSGEGRVNNVCTLTDAAQDYSPDGRALLSVSVLGLPKEENLPERIQEELVGWFGTAVNDWTHLRTDVIPRALPEQLPGVERNGFQVERGVYVCGDHTLSASIEGAVISGKLVAEEIAKNDHGK